MNAIRRRDREGVGDALVRAKAGVAELYAEAAEDRHALVAEVDRLTAERDDLLVRLGALVATDAERLAKVEAVVGILRACQTSDMCKCETPAAFALTRSTR